MNQRFGSGRSRPFSVAITSSLCATCAKAIPWDVVQVEMARVNAEWVRWKPPAPKPDNKIYHIGCHPAVNAYDVMDPPRNEATS